MITQETKPVKTWGGFNLAILKVKSKSTRKNRSSYNKTYKPPRSTSYCYPPVELTDTTTWKLRIHGLLLSWILHQIQAHPLMFSLSFNDSNWIDYQGVENFFSLKTLSLCEEKLLKDLTRDSHKPQYEQKYNSQAIKTLERFGYKTLKSKEAL